MHLQQKKKTSHSRSPFAPREAVVSHHGRMRAAAISDRAGAVAIATTVLLLPYSSKAMQPAGLSKQNRVLDTFVGKCGKTAPEQG
jgi:hypothetical protein